MARKILYVMAGLAVLGGMAASYLTASPGGTLAGICGGVLIAAIAECSR